MRKWKVWLLIALGILGSVVAWALLGRNVWNTTTTRVGSAAPGSATQERAMSDVCKCDTSGHKVSFVTVEPGVQLEVLDWGGTGQTLVLLTGMGAITPPEISSKIHEGLQPAEYDRIQAPALGIFNIITPQYRLPYYWYLDPAKQEEFNRNIESLAKWIEGAIQRFRSGVKNSRVIELHDTNHHVFIVEEALVVRETRKFLLGE
jgi:hypothetical protein